MRPTLHLACVFPPMPEDELKALADDIRMNGLVEPIAMLDGQILDGRCRWDACELAGVEPRTVPYEGDDPVGFVLSRNRHRRHLSKSQLAMIVADLVNLRPGSNQFQEKKEVVFKKDNLSAKRLSKQAGVPVAYTNFARSVRKNGAPHIERMVRDGVVNVHVAAEATRQASREKQAGWTVDDVEREGRKVINAYPSNRRGAGKSKSKAKAKPGRIEIPYKSFTFPTAEETGFPVNGTVQEKDAFYMRYGRTPIYPKVITHLLESQQRVGCLVQAIIATTNVVHPDADQFFADIEHMLAHVPQMDKHANYRIDFAAKARRQLATLRERLPRALKLLSALDAKLRAFDASVLAGGAKSALIGDARTGTS